MSRSGLQEAWGCDERELAEEFEVLLKEQIESEGGQKFLKALLQALDGMEDKRLWADSFELEEGGCCAIGALANAIGLSLDDYQTDAEFAKVAKLFGTGCSLLQYVTYLNDTGLVEDYHFVRNEQGLRRYIKNENAETERWQKMREWVLENLKGEKCENTELV